MGKLNEATHVDKIGNNEFISILLEDGTIGKITLSEIAKILAKALPQPEIIFRGQSGNSWVRIAEISNLNSAMFRIDGYTYRNQSPASIVISVVLYDTIKSVSFNVIAGKVGGTYEMQCRYKYVNNKVIFWVKSAMDGASIIKSLVGNIVVPLILEEPPSDAILLF